MVSSFFVFEFLYIFLVYEIKLGGIYVIFWRFDLVKVFGVGYVFK